MDELELVRLHEDGDRLVVTGPDGAEHTLPITDALRAAVRGDRPRMEAIRADEQLAMRPRDIQARLRAGATADELAAESGMPAEQIRRFEYPVLAEREHAVGRVRAKAVMSDDGGTATIGDLADKRLRDRGSDPTGVRWTATREGIAPWVVTLTFAVDAGERVARWSFDPRGGAVIALDDEARWLALPEDDGGPVSRTVTALPPTRGYGRATVVDDETDLLLDGLSERRGQRPQRSAGPVDIDAGELDLDDLSPRRRRPETGATASVRPAAGRSGSGRSGAGAARSDAGRDDGGGRESGGGAASHGGGSAASRGESAEQSQGPAAVVDLEARRGKHGTGPGAGPAGERSAGEVPPAGESAPGPQLEWDGPSQWEIPGPDADDERRPRTAALRTGGPLTGAIPKALRPAAARPSGDDAAGKGSAPGKSVAGDPAAAGSAARVSTAGSGPEGDGAGGRQPADRSGPEKAKPARRRPSRRGRAQVPSWDEIVFGSRPES